MRLTPVLAAALVVGFAGSAMADEYYVVKDPDTHNCKIVTTKPSEKEVVTQIGPIAFKTREEAESKVKTVKDCSND